MSSVVDVTVPVGQAEGTESVVGSWFKAVGDDVAENEPLLEISTDKVNMEVASPGSGRLSEILKQEGEAIEPGDVLGRIKMGGTSSSASGDLSPAVRRLLKEHNLDAAAISGTGKGGRITHQDVLDFVASRATPGATKPPARPAGAAGSGMPGRMVPHSQMRRSIAQHMVHSVNTAPHVTSVFDSDLSAVIAHRDASKAEFESRGAKLTFTAYFVRAATEALKAVPEANSRWHDDALEIFDDINIGIATALVSGGLIVPVIMKAQERDLFGIAERLQDITVRAREGRLDPKDVQNGTFTISNHGVSGSLVAVPIIINQPQSAILGIGKVERRAVAADADPEAIAVKPMCYVSLTIDHRVLDGYQANQFLTSFVAALRNP